MSEILERIFDYSGITTLPTLLMVLLLGLAIPYAVLRIRDAHSDQPDPNIGLKCALFLPFSLGILVFLLGATAVALELASVDFSEMWDKLSEFEEGVRPGLGMMLGGFVIAFLHMLLIFALTNNYKWPSTRRVFVGMRFAIHSVILVGVLLTLAMKVFEDQQNFDHMKPAWAILVVWGPSWFIHMMLLKVYRGSGSKPRASDADNDDD